MPQPTATTSSKPLTPEFSWQEFESAQDCFTVEVNSECKMRVRLGEEPDIHKRLTCDECPAQPGQLHAIGCGRELCPECCQPLMHCKDVIAFD